MPARLARELEAGDLETFRVAKSSTCYHSTFKSINRIMILGCKRKPRMTVHSLPFILVTQRNRQFLLTSMTVKLLATIAYASVRGSDEEEGAVQRMLNTRRISSIKQFSLTVGDFPASIVLNWVNKEHPLLREQDRVFITEMPRSAQLIDGQHRVAGLRTAMEENADIGLLQIPVAMYEGLTTKDCASLFISINTEQKPVPRSLVYDLYGVADQNVIDAPAARARDIALALNEEEDSPYYELIKLPGSPRRRGGIALSTAVTAIKPLVEPKGDFEQRGITEFEMQKQIIKNLFDALKHHYGRAWDDPKNAFMYASGFIGATEFLRTRLLSYGQDRKSYTKKTFIDALQISPEDLILQDEVKGKGGKDAPHIILDRLNSFFAPVHNQERNFEV